MSNRAFTMLELIFVIVVLGVLAAAIIPRMDRDSIYEAAEQVTSHIKYTQQLAMSDNVYQDDVQNWHYARWSISFVNNSGGCGQFYRIGSDNDLDGGGVFEKIEAARDPLSNDLLYNNNSNPCVTQDDWHNDILLTEKYAITSVANSTGCDGKTINFDHLGRPYTGFGEDDPTGHLMKADCNLTLTDSSGNTATITITRETGHTYITY